MVFQFFLCFKHHFPVFLELLSSFHYLSMTTPADPIEKRMLFRVVTDCVKKVTNILIYERVRILFCRYSFNLLLKLTYCDRVTLIIEYCM